MKRKDRIRNIGILIDLLKKIPKMRLYKGKDGRNKQIFIDHLLASEKIILEHLEKTTGTKPLGGLKGTKKVIEEISRDDTKHGTTTEMVDFDIRPILMLAYQTYLQEQEAREKFDNEPDF